MRKDVGPIGKDTFTRPQKRVKTTIFKLGAFFSARTPDCELYP